MIKLLITIAITLSPQVSEARWLKAWCARHIIADDPWQYMDHPTNRMIGWYRELGADVHWRKERPKARTLYGYGQDLRRRLKSGVEPQEMVDAIIEALEDYDHLEEPWI
jgi:hypothetical protein